MASFLAADNQTQIAAPPLAEGINSVLVRGQSNRILADSEQLVLLEFPVDLTQDVTLADDDLVLTKEDQVIAQSHLNIGYRTGFFGDSNAPQDITGFRIDPNEDTVFGPIAGVKVNVEEFAYPGGFDFTTDVWAPFRVHCLRKRKCEYNRYRSTDQKIFRPYIWLIKTKYSD